MNLHNTSINIDIVSVSDKIATYIIVALLKWVFAHLEVVRHRELMLIWHHAWYLKFVPFFFFRQTECNDVVYVCSFDFCVLLLHSFDIECDSVNIAHSSWCQGHCSQS